MSHTKDEPRNKHLRLSQGKIRRAREILGADTDTEAIELALDYLIAESERDALAVAVHERFLANTDGEIRDLFGALDER